MTKAFETVVASAPGKVILFGEHAVVYGVTAIAAALSDLRIFVEISSIPDDSIEVQLYDVIVPPYGKSFHHKITLSKVRSLFDESFSRDVLHPIDPDEDSLNKLKTEFQDAPVAATQCLMAIMYLIARVIPECLWPKPDSGVSYGGLRLEIKSKGLPIGAGLGSSAAFSVALSAALLRLKQQLQPFLELDDAVHDNNALDTASHLQSAAATATAAAATATAAAATAAAAAGTAAATALAAAAVAIKEVQIRIQSSASSSSRTAIPVSLLPTINGWAYAAEVVIHGSPSGLDNTTSCYGGAVRFKKGEATFQNISKEVFPQMRILLTNTRVPRSTKLLVARVRQLHDKMPKVVIPILESIEGVSGCFLEIIEKTKQRKSLHPAGSPDTQHAFDEETEAAEIGLLFRINHSLLCALDVSHSSLEAVVKASASEGLSCKLTGAGGGGCAITLLPMDAACETDSMEVQSGSVGAVDRLKASLGELGFEAFESSLAGDGVQWP